MKSRLIHTALITTIAAAVLSACGSATPAATGTSATVEVPSSSASSLSPTTATTTTAITVALSSSPNTDYTGMYVAQQRGYYASEGIELQIVPYATTAPETLIANGKVDFGFTYQAGVAYARAAGQDVVAVFAPDQKGTHAIGVAADRTDITRPQDLDGKVYAGFGTPDELPLLRTIITNDGGTGDFTNVDLNTSAYAAVHGGAADFTIPVTTWEGVQAKAAGKPMKFFALTDYGFPDQYSILLASSRHFLQTQSDLAKRFLAATQKGYAFAAQHPVDAAKDMISADAQAFADPQLVIDSHQALVDGGYLTDANGEPLKTEPDWGSYYTNDYLPAP
ncbi:MAG: ABC transporter substrate-binding protein [Actinobacteria bacterium]|nr:ABC transporter substrate-binding protein [Actinomycetota bacterium]